MTRADWLAQIADLEQRGELLRAVDHASRGLSEHTGDRDLAYRLVLCLARAGATESASRRYHALGLDHESDEDSAALGARLLKDRALGSRETERKEALLAAAERYAAVHAETGGYFPAINSATLFRLADDPRAVPMARRALDAVVEGADGLTGYYAAATLAEAHLVLGNEHAAREALVRAGRLDGGGRSARASTRRQLRLLCRHLDIADDLLECLANPPVVHYCGHRVPSKTERERLPREFLDAIANDIRRELESVRPCAGYGSLAAGADILIAEALQSIGAELYVVLPCDRDDFIGESVEPAGDEWVARFHSCMDYATSVHYVTTGPYLGDSTLFAHGSSVAMGLACLRAAMLDSRPIQIGVWDRRTTGSVVGTEGSVEHWARLGHSQIIIESRARSSEPSKVPTPAIVDGSRQFKAIVFADFDGFSSLPEVLVPEFVTHALGAVAASLRGFEGRVSFRNTWGDGLYVVFDDLLAAAEWSLDLQTRLARGDWRAGVLPSSLTLRVSCHYAPVFACQDPVVERPGYFGSEVSKTARIEPITPEGSVYVTEPFAALLALESNAGFACDYVGSVPTAKGYGDLPLYLLRRAQI